jgi:hypothetical protein
MIVPLEMGGLCSAKCTQIMEFKGNKDCNNSIVLPLSIFTKPMEFLLPAMVRLLYPTRRQFGMWALSMLSDQRLDKPEAGYIVRR